MSRSYRFDVSVELPKDNQVQDKCMDLLVAKIRDEGGTCDSHIYGTYLSVYGTISLCCGESDDDMSRKFWSAIKDIALRADISWWCEERDPDSFISFNAEKNKKDVQNV